MEIAVVLFRSSVVGLVLIIASVNSKFNLGDVVITGSGSEVRGIRMTVSKTEVDVFYGIPYAKPPVGDLRFRAPVPIDGWEGVLHATKKPNACFQNLDTMNYSKGADVWNANTELNEDCLYLNVWVPRPSSRDKHKDVLVWIFGGGFYSGSSALDVYDAKYLAAENDIIVVSMQYRLGSLGFLALYHPEALGNAGMLDQVMALTWVNQNIIRFGGNPNSVTIMGESAGAVSVGMHMLSPLSRHLFDRAILQSGAPNAAWATLPKKEAFNRSMVLAQKVGCDFNDTLRVIQCLRKVHPQTLIDVEWDTVVYGAVRFPMVPIVDGAFLLESPEKSLHTNNFKKCPVLMGHNTNEASFWLIYFDSQAFPPKGDSRLSRTGFDRQIDAVFRYHPYYPRYLNSFGLDAIKFQYRNWINPDDQRKNAWNVDMATSDFNFVCPVVDMAQHIARAGQDVFYYVFEHRSSVHMWPEWMGVLHGDEIFFAFGEPLDRSKGYTDKEIRFAKHMMRYWTNFAKTGDPNKSPGGIPLDEWPRFDTTTRKHLILKPEFMDKADKSIAIGAGSRATECAFWKEYLPDLILQTEEQKSTDFKLRYCQEHNIDKHVVNPYKNHEPPPVFINSDRATAYMNHLPSYKVVYVIKLCSMSACNVAEVSEMYPDASGHIVRDF